MKLVTVVGARPQFIKASAVSRAIREQAGRMHEVLLHTGQHYDANMSEVFFTELDIPPPHYNLAVGSGSHGQQTGRMLAGIEEVLIRERPDWLLVYGDTNSTLAGALAAKKLHIPVAHVEAGLRCHNMAIPEEINRVVTDRISDVLFCPTAVAVENLAHEGQRAGVERVGDVMFDCVRHFGTQARRSSAVLERLRLQEKQFALVTVHRGENTDEPVRLAAMFAALAELADHLTVVLPLHPRARRKISGTPLEQRLDRLVCIEPVSYFDMVRLESAARVILTDSGGVQKEAFFHGVPCVTMREETEWPETLADGWNRLVGADRERIVAEVLSVLAEEPSRAGAPPTEAYGDGFAAQKIVARLLR